MATKKGKVLFGKVEEALGDGKTTPDNARPKKSPWETANVVSYITFMWATPLIRRAFKKELSMEDVWPLREADTVDSLYRPLKMHWDAEQKLPPKQRSLLRAIWKTYRRPFWICFLLQMLYMVACIFSSSLVLAALLRILEQRSAPGDATVTFLGIEAYKETWRGYGLAFAFCASEGLRSVFVCWQWMFGNVTGTRVRSAVRLLLFKKTLRLKNCSVPTGQLVNFIANDTQRMLDAGGFGMFCVSSPIIVVVVLIVMTTYLGWAAVAGFAIMLMLFPAQQWIGKRLGGIRKKAVQVSGRRVQLVQEILNGIKLIKLYAWEGAFAAKVQEVRKEEVRHLTAAAYVKTFNEVITFSMPFLVALSTFAAYYLITDADLTASKAFPALALFNVARFPLAVLPQGARAVAEALVGVRRLERLLALDELEGEERLLRNQAAGRDDRDGEGEGKGEDDGLAVVMDHATLHWGMQDITTLIDREGKGKGNGKGKGKGKGKGTPAEAGLTKARDEPVTGTAAATGAGPATGARGALTDISLRIKKGELVAIVGAVGAGKSSLLTGALLGQMHVKGGTVEVRESVALCEQSAYVFNATLRENILFGQPYDEARYARAVAACALGPDLAQLPAGDMTEVGERGINLSGGQKARVSLARAVYSRKRLYLLDDPLAAVDAHVAEHLFRRCLGNNDGGGGESALAGTTRLLVTHQVQYLPRVDRVVVMEKGRVVADGTYAELSARGVLTSAVPELLAGEGEGGEKMMMKKAAAAAAASAPAVGRRLQAKTERKGEKKGSVDMLAPTPKNAEAKLPEVGAKTETEAARQAREVTGRLVKKEARELGAVKRQVLGKYWRAAGGLHVGVAMVVLFAAGQATKTGSDWWVAAWTTQSIGRGGGSSMVFDNSSSSSSSLGSTNTNGDDGHSQAWYLSVYAALVAAVVVVNLARVFAWAYYTLVAAQRLHARVFGVLLTARMAFFDATPSGRVLNVFAGDMDLVDTKLPETAEKWFFLLLQILFALGLIATIIPWFLLALIPLIAFFVVCTVFFRRAVRQLKRMDNITRSPLFAHFGSTMAGLLTIRAYGQRRRFEAEHCRLCDETARTYLAFYVTNRWIGFRLDFVTTLIAFATATLCVVLRDSLSPGLAGLALVSALQLAGIFQYTTRLTSETEAYFTSVERVVDFEETTPLEAAATVPALEAALEAEAWPAVGCLEFVDYSCRYRDGLPLVLKGVSLRVEGGHRVGVVGRTGSGKSTLGLCVFRVLEAAGGRLLLDGRNVADVGLRQLRSRLAIIPQEPVLFKGSVRHNLDPFDEFGDGEVWDALGHVHMRTFVEDELAERLATPVVEGGSNFSAGQRQLFCFARALLRKSRVIVMDEATASVDVETDVLIQRTIRSSFPGQTLLVVAHRLQTVADADRVLVLDSGEVKEYGHPHLLLQKAPPARGRGRASGGKGGAWARPNAGVEARAGAGAGAGGEEGGWFAELVEMSEGTSAAELRAMAAAAFRQGGGGGGAGAVV